MHDQNCTSQSKSIKFEKLSFFTILSVSFFALTVSEGFKYFGQLQPCTFCKIQALCYLLLVVASSSAAFLLKSIHWKSRFHLMWIVLGAIAFTGFITSIIHLAIQWQWIGDFCEVAKVADFQTFKETIFKPQHATSCAKITFSILGVPASAFNALFFLTFTILSTNGWLSVKQPQG